MFERDGYDVIVAGGGCAGVAAALAAARAGARTALIEKTVFPGGLATAGNVLIYLPLSDARGKQVTFGLAEELLHASFRYGPGDVPPDWQDPNTRSRYGVRFSPASFVLAMDEILIEAGVEIWFDTLICEAAVSGQRVTGVEIENKSGRGLLSARCFVDATGDADVAFRAGAPCADHKNSLSIWALGVSLEQAKLAAGQADGTPLLMSVTQLGADSERSLNCADGGRSFYGTDGRDVSQYILESRRLLRKKYQADQAQAGPDGRKNIFPITLPAMADMRMTRRIMGHYTLKTGEYEKHFDDSVGLVADWRGGRQVWELPYRALLPRKVKGLLTAGRCCSTEGEAWQVMRVIQAAAMSGEVCGLAAAMSARRDTTPDALEPRAIQDELKARGFLLDVGSLESP